MRPPNVHSGATWQPFTDRSGTYLTAGLTSVPGIGDSKAAAIFRAREEQPFHDWPDMIRANGIGPATVEKMKQFSLSNDPFGLEVIDRTIARVVKDIKNKKLKAPMPTMTGEQVSAEKAPPWGSGRKGKRFVYAGLVKARRYQDVVENVHSRTGDDPDDIVKYIKEPDLREYCALECVDGGIEEVYIRINRFVFPAFRGRLERIEVGHDVVIVVGRKTPGFGNSIAVDELYVIDPD